MENGKWKMIDIFSPLLLRKVSNFIRSLGLAKAKPLKFLLMARLSFAKHRFSSYKSSYNQRFFV
ncbi:hypothetical protein, partial [Clostridium cochlearium]|uniref:hypothetical protein n=1 Tax=Clostridium cochlearium TaxID=1494 RepID=UPI001EDEC41B